MMFTLFYIVCLSEAVVEVRAVQPGSTFRTEGVRTFFNFYVLTVHVRDTNIH